MHHEKIILEFEVIASFIYLLIKGDMEGAAQPLLSGEL